MSLDGFRQRYPDSRYADEYGRGALELWREPDIAYGDDFAIWYGHSVWKLADCALLVERIHGQAFEVTEYTGVAGYEWYDPSENKPYLTQSTVVTAPSPRLAANWGTAKLGYQGGQEGWEDELP